MMKRGRSGALVVAVLIAAAFVAGNATAMSLAEAKAQRLVAEGMDGLIHATEPGPSATVRQLISQTNDGRMDRYRDIAGRRNIPVDEVKKVAASELIKRTPPDQCIEAGSGRYVQKGSGAGCP